MGLDAPLPCRGNAAWGLFVSQYLAFPRAHWWKIYGLLILLTLPGLKKDLKAANSPRSLSLKRSVSSELERMLSGVHQHGQVEKQIYREGQTVCAGMYMCMCPHLYSYTSECLYVRILNTEKKF